MVFVTILMDDKLAENRALKAEHGLSMWFETGTEHFLFDCGAGEATAYNAKKLGIDLSSADFTVCTHSHYDHAAGYRNLAESGMGGRILYTGPGFFEKKYALSGHKYVNLSCGFSEDFLQKHNIEHRVCENILQLSDKCWLIGHFAHPNSFETIPERFVKGTLPYVRADDFSDEICLAVESKKGLIIFVGCSHPGVLNMAETVRDVLKKPVYALLGGTHLVEANTPRIKKTFEALKQMGISVLGLGHCSGGTAVQMLEEYDGLRGCDMPVGSCFAFE